MILPSFLSNLGRDFFCHKVWLMVLTKPVSSKTIGFSFVRGFSWKKISNVLYMYVNTISHNTLVRSYNSIIM